MFSLPEAVVSRNEEKKCDEGVTAGSEEDPDSRETMAMLAELVDSDLLRFASQRLMAFASPLERSGIFEPASARSIVPGGKY